MIMPEDPNKQKIIFWLGILMVSVGIFMYVGTL